MRKFMSRKETVISASAAAESSSSMADRVGRATSFTLTQPSAPVDGCYRCRQEIYISFFFDGLGHSLEDGSYISNIGRLYNAHKATKKENGIYSLYYAGMGRPLSRETIGIAGTLAANLVGGTTDAVTDAVTDSIGDARKDATNDLAKGTIEAYRAGKKGGVKSALVHAFETFAEGVKPGAILKKVGASVTSPKTIIPVVTQAAADAYPPVRDMGAAAAWIGTGFNARVEQAERDFTSIIEQAHSDPRPIKFIRISMFGFDRGAVAARKFANELIEKVCKKEGGQNHLSRCRSVV
jgi:hypothetical protein